jgi:hypothetical protein
MIAGNANQVEMAESESETETESFVEETHLEKSRVGDRSFEIFDVDPFGCTYSYT